MMDLVHLECGRDRIIFQKKTAAAAAAAA